MVKASPRQANEPAGQMTPVVVPLLNTIEAIVGPALLVDLSFPRASLAENPAHECTRFLRLPRSESESGFLLRFRQAGGHTPITAINFFDSDFTWPPPQISQESRSIVVSFEDSKAAAAASERLRESRSSLLVPAQSESTANLFMDRANLQEYRYFRLIDNNTGASYDLFVAPHAAHEQRPESDIGLSEDSNDVIFTSEGSNVAIEARSMIHDGGYASEGDIKYSWLWTGPSTHFRLILPQVAGVRPRLAEICVSRTEEDSNIDLLAVQLDGRTIKHHVERWSAMSGKITVDIPAGTDYSVLTLIVPKLTRDANSGRLLGLCCDKLMLTP